MLFSLKRSRLKIHLVRLVVLSVRLYNLFKDDFANDVYVRRRKSTGMPQSTM